MTSTEVDTPLGDPGVDTVHDSVRLAALRETALLDSPREESFDRLTRLAAALTGAPVTFISLVDDDRDFYKSCFGFPEPLASQRELKGTTFCHFALVSEGPLIINDTLSHPIYRNVPTVESLGIRAYLGIPLITSAGHALGSFCAVDFAPRKWSALDIEVMRELAASTLREIELRSAVETARNTQQILENEREQLRVILENVPAGVVMAEAPSGRLLLKNSQVEKIAGAEFITEDEEQLWRNRVAYHENGERVKLDEWPIARGLCGEKVKLDVLYERKDGHSVWLRIQGAPVYGADGAITGCVVAMYDVSKERAIVLENARLYEEALQANHAKDEFFAMVSHELRAPMTAILGWTELLGLHEGNSDATREALNAITRSARLQAKLVDDLLDVSRISTGKMTLSLEPLDLNEIVSEAVREAQTVAASQGLALHTRLSDLTDVNGDRFRLTQVVSNLLSNAIKFTPAGGLIEVVTEERDDAIFLSVRDTGRGISRELLPLIFDRHRQARDGEGGGLGLGLTIVQNLVHLHNGEIIATSEGDGKGATFTVRLPV